MQFCFSFVAKPIKQNLFCPSTSSTADIIASNELGVYTVKLKNAGAVRN